VSLNITRGGQSVAVTFFQWFLSNIFDENYSWDPKLKFQTKIGIQLYFYLRIEKIKMSNHTGGSGGAVGTMSQRGGSPKITKKVSPII